MAAVNLAALRDPPPPRPRRPTRRALEVAPSPVRPACADRLDLVDAAYERSGAKHTGELRRLCRTCPLARGCLDWAMTNPEWGVWGGTSPYERTAHGGPSARAVFKSIAANPKRTLES